ncbi:MAG: BlaI/MecI/CopY family transcriptional regulator [Planctomycetaceae bacterium]
MGPLKKRKRGLAPREQQIMDVVYLLGTASVAEVREKLTDPPSYSAVRTMMGQLERKGLLKRDKTGVKHVYSPTKSRKVASRSALRNLIDTFFPDAPGAALAKLIDDTANNLTDEDLDRLEQAIQRARREDKET